MSGGRSVRKKPQAHPEVILPDVSAVSVAIMLSVVAPFVPELPGLLPFTIRFIALLVAAAAWVWALALEPDRFAPWNRVHLATGAVLVVALVSSLVSFSPRTALTFGAEESLMGLPSWLAIATVFALSSRVRLEPQLRTALDSLLVLASISASIVLVQRAAGLEVTGGFGNSNYVGAVLVAVLPLGLVRFRTGEGAGRKAYASATILLTMGVIFCGSLAAVVALVVLFALTSLVAPSLLAPRRERIVRIAGVTTLVLGVLISSLGVATLAGYSTPGPTDTLIRDRILGPTATTRIEMWRMALEIFSSHPLLGVGPDGFAQASEAVLPVTSLRSLGGEQFDFKIRVRDPHSLPALAISGIGLVGVLALMWLLVEWAWDVRAKRSVVGSSGGDATAGQLWSQALALGVAACLLDLMFVPWTIVLGPLVSLLAGLAIAPSAILAVDSRRRAVGGAAAFAAPSAAVALTLIVVALALSAALGDLFVAAAHRSTDPVVAEAAYLRAQAVQPTRPYLEYERLYAHGFLAASGLRDMAQYRVSVDDASREVRESGGFMANLVQVVLDDAYLRGRHDLSWEQERLAQAFERAPNHPDVVAEAAHLALLLGDVERARQLLDTYAGLAGVSGERYELYEYYYAAATGDPAADEHAAGLLADAGPAVSRLVRGWDR